MRLVTFASLSISLLSIACGRDIPTTPLPSPSLNQSHDRNGREQPNDPHGWQRVVFGELISMSMPLDARHAQSEDSHGHQWFVETPRFAIHVYHDRRRADDEAAEGFLRLWAGQERLKETEAVVDHQLARFVHLRQQFNSDWAKMTPRETDAWPLGFKVFINQAPTSRYVLYGEAGCDSEQGCREAEGVIRSSQFLLNRPNQLQRKQGDLPVIPLPTPR
jgi:hypothetical protein